MSAVDIWQIFTVAQAWASGAAEAEHHAPSIHDIWFPLANFLIYALILFKFVLPLVRDFLKSRRDEVVQTIAQVSAKKAAAQALVSEYQHKLAAVDREMQSIQAALREEGEREKAKLLNEAAAAAQKIKEDAAFLADQEMKMARQKIREEMARQAEAHARALIQRHFSQADQNRLVQDFIESIGEAR
ncbi:MAG TPA: ATP synthase F0 subunit B [Candidatus Binatia bacterium]|nr:ATP synthase F0 subunit B [Candidatus Binatia bacterium]